MEEENKENNFERLLKQKAEVIELSPAPEVWENVSASLQNSRRKKYFVWMLSALLMVVMGGGFFMLLGKKTEPSMEKHSSIQDQYSEKERKTSVIIAQSNSTAGIEATKNPQAARISNRDTDLKEKSNPVFQSVSPAYKQANASGKSAPSSNDILSAETESIPNDNESISPIAIKELGGLSFKENTAMIQCLTTDLNMASTVAHNSNLFIEAEGMPLMSLVWNQYSSSSGSTQLQSLAPASDSYVFAKGFSAGGNFFGMFNNKWIAGGGIHFSKTHLEAISNQEIIPQYSTDTASNMVDSFFVLNTQNLHAINQWLDFTVFGGVQLFPSSSNHIQIRIGGGWSHLLSSSVSANESSSAFFDNSAGTAGNIPAVPYSVFDYRKNQLQLFSDVSYVRDLSPRFSISGGLQLHYLPFDLIANEEVNQHLLWLSAKAGLIFRL